MLISDVPERLNTKRVEGKIQSSFFFFFFPCFLLQFSPAMKRRDGQRKARVHLMFPHSCYLGRVSTVRPEGSKSRKRRE